MRHERLSLFESEAGLYPREFACYIGSSDSLRSGGAFIACDGPIFFFLSDLPTCFLGWICTVQIDPGKPLTMAGEELDDLQIDHDLPKVLNLPLPNGLHEGIQCYAS